MATEPKYKLAGGVELPPFRSLSDFLMGKARYEPPPHNNFSNWQNRIIANLLYYQTNYFLTFFAIFIFENFFYAQDTVLGLLTIILCLIVAKIMWSSEPYYVQLRRDHKYVGIGIVVVTIQIFGWFLGSVLNVTFCVLFPIFLILCHASVRLRSTMNKITQTAEKFGIRTTVMGRFLDFCGVDVRI